MKKIVKTSSHRRVLLAVVLLCAALLFAWIIYNHQRPGGNAADLLQPPQKTVHSLSDDTIAKWTLVLKSKPNDDAAWASLGDAFMEKARETLDLSYYGRAERAYNKAISLNSKNIPAANGLAWVNGGRHEFEKSIEWVKKAIALDPTDEPAYGLWGDADQEMGDYEAAYTHYQKMLDMHPDFSSWTRGARWCWLTGNTKKAEFLYREAINAGASYKENVAWARAQLGLLYFNDGNYAAAEQILLEGLNFSPNNYHLLSIMGRVQAAKKDYARAIRCYEKATAVAPMLDSIAALGDLYMLTGKKEEAEKQFSLMETIDKLFKANGVKGDMLLAKFYAEHERNLPEALRMEEEEYKTRKNVYVADTLAWCYYKLGRYHEAAEMIKAALRTNTPEAMFWFHSGMISAKLGDRTTAQMSLYRAQSSNPAFNPVYEPLLYQTFKELGSHPPVTASANPAPVVSSSGSSAPSASAPSASAPLAPAPLAPASQNSFGATP